MNKKWQWAALPACITFGPFFAAGGPTLFQRDGMELWIPLAGTAMVVAGLGMLMGLIFQQRQELEKLLAERTTKPVD